MCGSEICYKLKSDKSSLTPSIIMKGGLIISRAGQKFVYNNEVILMIIMSLPIMFIHANLDSLNTRKDTQAYLHPRNV